jgi:hypothetical protein
MSDRAETKSVIKRTAVPMTPLLGVTKTVHVFHSFNEATTGTVAELVATVG